MTSITSATAASVRWVSCSEPVSVGLTRLERIVKERMTLQDIDTLTPNNLLNPKPLLAAIREFFGSSQLSQFMDQTNPLSELTHKRRLSALGPGGLTRERAGFAVRDIHPSHYGRICPVETPEGPNAGLIGSLATYARVNEYGFLETPYWEAKDGKLTGKSTSCPPMKKTSFGSPRAMLQRMEDGTLLGPHVPVRYRNEFTITEPTTVDYVGVSPIQIVSVGTALIPFLEHDDANRALMGSNMQRQSVPLVRAERPMVGTGLERRVAMDLRMSLAAEFDGTVERVPAKPSKSGARTGKAARYPMVKYLRSNQDTCLNHRPVVKAGEKVVTGQVIADGSASHRANWPWART